MYRKGTIYWIELELKYFLINFKAWELFKVDGYGWNGDDGWDVWYEWKLRL